MPLKLLNQSVLYLRQLLILYLAIRISYPNFYVGHSIKKVNFAEEDGNWKHCLELHFFEEIKWCDLLCLGRLSVRPSLLTDMPGNFFLLESQCFSTVFSTFWLTYVLPICKHFLPKTYFSIHITHFSVNFIWLAVLSHQKFVDRPLFKSGAHLIFHNFE